VDEALPQLRQGLTGQHHHKSAVRAQKRGDMASAKEQMAKIVQEQPDDSSYDEILRELAFARMIERGLADSQTGRTIGDEEMKRRIRTWQK
jgi:predicted transcriptional regulator